MVTGQLITRMADRTWQEQLLGSLAPLLSDGVRLLSSETRVKADTCNYTCNYMMTWPYGHLVMVSDIVICL